MNAEIKITEKKMNFLKKDTVVKTDKMDELKEMGVISDKCNCSIYSMATVAGGILLAVGAVIFSLIAM